MSILTKLSQLSPNLSPATQKKIVVTNNYDMPILTEFLQLNPSQSPELKSIMKTSNSTKSLQSPHKFVKMMKVNSPTTTTISIPNTADDENTTIDEEKSKNQLLTDSIESNLFTDAWNEKNTQALRANFLKKVFGGGDGGSGPSTSNNSSKMSKEKFVRDVSKSLERGEDVVTRMDPRAFESFLTSEVAGDSEPPGLALPLNASRTYPIASCKADSFSASDLASSTLKSTSIASSASGVSPKARTISISLSNVTPSLGFADNLLIRSLA